MHFVLEASALFFGAVYFGSTTYITLVEAPGRLAAAPDFAITHWKYCMLATPRYAASALLAAFAGLFIGKGHLSSPWTLGGVLLLLVLPITALTLVPLQRDLASSSKISETEAIRKSVKRWSIFHGLRTFLGCASYLLFLRGALGVH